MIRSRLLIAVSIAILSSCTAPSTDENPNLGLYLPEDLEAELWAESPMMYNPTNMDVDAKGRIWITEAVNYRNFNNDSTRALHHSKGDRVMILEDTNGDGKADRSKLYVQDPDLVAPLGIGVIGNKVYVSCSPNLIVYTDNDGDDKPDTREVFLTGFGGKDHDHALHSLMGGFDGKLYFNVGNAGPHIVTDRSGWTLRAGSIYTGGSPYNRENQGNMKSDDGEVYVGGLAMKINPDGTGLKVVGHNFRNAYELMVDSRGDMWQNDNDDQVLTCRTTWLMEGGNAGYFSADGTRYWQADQRPWQDIFSAHWHQDDPGVMPAGDNFGPGSPTGVVMNEDDGLGKKYRGLLLSADAGRNVIFSYRPEISGAGFAMGKYGTLITSLKEDNTRYEWADSAENARPHKWFRPSDVCIGTDGAIYVADWFDPVVGGHQMKDSTGYGRIYRIKLKGTNPSAPAYDFSSVAGLAQALKSPAVNVRYFAFEELKKKGNEAFDAVQELLAGDNPFHHARAIWLLPFLGDRGKQRVEELLSDKDENKRVVAYRVLRNLTDDVVSLAARAANDPSGFVRREAVVSLKGVPYEKAKPVLLELIKKFDGSDRWYLETLGYTLKGNEEDAYRESLRLFGDADKDPSAWSKQSSAMAWRLHPPSSVGALKQRAMSAALDSAERAAAITALAFINTSAAASAMVAVAGDSSQGKAMSDQAVYWLSFRHSNDWFSLLNWEELKMNPEYERKLAEMTIKKNKVLDEKLPTWEKRHNAQEMAMDSLGGLMLLSMVENKLLPKDVYPYVEKHIFNNPNQSVRIQASLHFRNPAQAYPLSLPSIARLNGNPVAGEKVFGTACATCHKVMDNGRDIGPELSSIGKKFDKEGLLDAIVNPSAGIVFGYESWLINTSGGNTYFGFLVADGSKTVVIRDLSGQKHVIDASTITSRKKQDNSVMPEPSSLGLKEQDLADVASYLMNVAGNGKK